MYACLTGNASWFHTLFRMTGLLDIVKLRTRRNETLYHLVCTLPETEYSESNPKNIVPERLQILKMLHTTKIDINVKSTSPFSTYSTTKYIAFDFVATDCASYFNKVNDDHKPLIRWWLDHIDSFDVGNLNSCLPWLAYDNRLEDVQRLCRMESMDLNIKTDCGKTALTQASAEGHTAVVDELLSYYPYRLADLNHQDDMYDETALYKACLNNHVDTVIHLCRMPDVNLNIEDYNSDTALNVAVQQGNTSIVEELLKYYPDRLYDLNSGTNLYWASQKNHIDIVKILCLYPDVDLNLVYSQNISPLIAAKNGHTSVVEELLTYYPHRLTGTDLNNQDNDGNTAIYEASFNSHLDIVQILCRHPGIDLNLANQNGDTALTIAATQGHTSVVEELLTYYPHRLTGTDLNHQNKDGDTALMSASQNNHLDIVQILCRHPGIDLNLANKYGDTVLIITAWKGNVSIVGELLTYYPHRLTNLYHQNTNRDTAMSIARSNGYIPIMDALRNHGVTD